VYVAEAQSPDQSLRLLHPAAPIAVYEHDSAALDHQLAAQRQSLQIAIMVAQHSLDRRDSFEGGESLRPADIASMEDEIHASKHLEDSIRETIEELRAVGVRDDPDPGRQLLDPGRLQAGRVGAFGVGAPIERM